MKNVLRVGLLFVGIFWAFGISGNAQISRRYAVHIPFDFAVGKKLMKSGDYLIAPLSGIADQRAIFLQNRSNGKTAVLGQVSITSSESDKGRLLFARSGDQWLLSEVTTPGFTLRLKVKDAEAVKLASADKAGSKQTVVIGR
jgi:hypothetical protein